MFLISQYDVYLKTNFFNMFPFVLGLFTYFIPMIVLVLVVENYCDKEFKKLNLKVFSKKKS